MGGIIHQLIAVLYQLYTINAHLDPKDMPESAYVSRPQHSELENGPQKR